MSVERKTKIWKTDSIPHIWRNSKNSCFEQIAHVRSLLTMIFNAIFRILYVKAVEIGRVGFPRFCSLNKCSLFLTDILSVWRVISEGKMGLIRFRLTIKDSNFLFMFRPNRKTSSGLQNRYDRFGFMFFCPVVEVFVLGEKETKWFVFLLELNKSRNRTHAGNFLNVFLFNLFIFKLYSSERPNCESGYSCNSQSTVVVYAGLHKDSSMFLEWIEKCLCSCPLINWIYSWGIAVYQSLPWLCRWHKPHHITK